MTKVKMKQGIMRLRQLFEVLFDRSGAVKYPIFWTQKAKTDMKKRRIFSCVILGSSIDYGIMEKSDIVKVISADMGWSDVGSWDNLGVLHDTDANGNFVAGNHLAIDTKDCITYSKKRLITMIGVDNLIIVETEDAILVCDKNRAQDVKLIVDKLKEDGHNELL